MIFPAHCKEVGYASSKPCGDRVYFLSRYLIHEIPGGHDVLEVELHRQKKGMMREVISSSVLAGNAEVYLWPGRVQLHDRAGLVRKAISTGYRCTIFRGLDEHLTFVLDPDLSLFQLVHVYDAIPPRPSLSACIDDLELTGLFGGMQIQFAHHILDIATLPADMYPCRAAGFGRTLDRDPVIAGEHIAGCTTSMEISRECYGHELPLSNTCPLSVIAEEPFIARCCRKEREGPGERNGKFGTVVHWGASPAEIYQALREMVTQWRIHADRSC